ncbi:hypothetical protein GCM10009861_15940 [Neomicrococcus aestuarii]
MLKRLRLTKHSIRVFLSGTLVALIVCGTPADSPLFASRKGCGSGLSFWEYDDAGVRECPSASFRGAGRGNVAKPVFCE